MSPIYLLENFMRYRLPPLTILNIVTKLKADKKKSLDN